MQGQKVHEAVACTSCSTVLSSYGPAQEFIDLEMDAYRNNVIRVRSTSGVLGLQISKLCRIYGSLALSLSCHLPAGTLVLPGLS